MILIIKKLKTKEFEVNLILDKFMIIFVYILKIKLNAGADVIQIFDSWAGLIPPKDLTKLLLYTKFKNCRFL